MGRGKFKGKPTGRRQFSTPEEMIAGTSARRPRTFRQEEAEIEEEERSKESEEESEEDSDGEKKKGTQGIIEIENPNLVKPKNVKAKNVDIEKTTELSRRERYIAAFVCVSLQYDPYEVMDREAILCACYMLGMNPPLPFMFLCFSDHSIFSHFLLLTCIHPSHKTMRHWPSGISWSSTIFLTVLLPL